MDAVTFSPGVRSALLSLENTAQSLLTTQQRLATGKKVNSALDNPANFFTSNSLSNRASALNALIDQLVQPHAWAVMSRGDTFRQESSAIA
jgi:flagellin